ncbi:hypothetical protein ASPZODRAFT_88397 [Penicilliopsis zonata CBS 506.65]|uniref:Peptidase M13 N-terminal domain-containing protein n=1 Tax=Penicilliopsis zonata CBS 506.65 TaxID=1073090 RepID=A0A1L9SX05_9EURO|nr:hypothetical protein ASPZODRAFT_88397 [Penicilliopsis zonata CBS 506.65]OJJ51714.1 hypothetical protein ASPZODRAFT_88397 [Penicilliopsis zonata CBS 506.65]
MTRQPLASDLPSSVVSEKDFLPSHPSRNVAVGPGRETGHWSHRRWRSRVGYMGLLFLAALPIKYYFWPCENNRLAGTSPSSPHTLAPSICQTPECVHAASEILYNLDPNYADIDPCTDFDQFVCGGWRERHDMRSDQGSLFAGTIMAEESQTKLRHILEASKAPTASSSSSDDADNFNKLKDAYDACINDATIKERGKKPVDDMLASLEKIYSASSSSTKGPTKHLTDAILYLMEGGVEALVSPYVTPDDRNPDSVAIFVTPPRAIGLPAREYYNNTELVSEYGTVVRKVLGAFLGKESGDLASDLVAFESKLADVTPDTQTQEDVTQYYNPKTLKETSSLLPEVSFADIISALGPSKFKTDRLIVGSPSYMKSLSEILATTSRETVQNFFKWKIIQTYADTIEHASVTPLREFNNKLKGKDPQASEERWRKCIRVMDDDLGWVLSRFYILDSFSEDSKKLGDQIVSDIKERFIFTLQQTSWMSSEVRKMGIQKVENIVQKIGYPTRSPNVQDPKAVKEYYKSLPISHETFFENRVEAAKFALREEWSKLGKPTNRDEWEMTAPTVNAYYNPPGNEIVFPAGIMQPPTFYGPSAPLYLAYGAFGAVSGHELSHAFDSTGRHYDETGNYTDWWDSETVQAFEDRAQCFVDQYSNFTVPGTGSEPLHVNGRLTLGENIADAGGLAAAFHAWRKRDEASPDPLIPGLSTFSKEQLFFVSYASWWCSKTTREAAEEAIFNDPHAPKPARIIETMANSREFKDAFNCPKRDPVCKLW